MVLAMAGKMRARSTVRDPRSTALFAQWRLIFDPVYFLSFVILANCVLIDVKLST